MSKLQELISKKIALEKEINELEAYEKAKSEAFKLTNCMPNTPNMENTSIRYLKINIDSYDTSFGGITVPYNKDVSDIIGNAIKELSELLFKE